METDGVAARFEGHCPENKIGCQEFRILPVYLNPPPRSHHVRKQKQGRNGTLRLQNHLIHGIDGKNRGRQGRGRRYGSRIRCLIEVDNVFDRDGSVLDAVQKGLQSVLFRQRGDRFPG